MDSLSAIFACSFMIGFSGATMPGPTLTVTIHGAAQRSFWSGLLVVYFGGMSVLSGDRQRLGAS